MSQQSWPPANLSHNTKDNKALQRHICLFRESSRTMTSQGRSENSDQSGPLHPMLSNADRGKKKSVMVEVLSAVLCAARKFCGVQKAKKTETLAKRFSVSVAFITVLRTEWIDLPPFREPGEY